MFVATHPLALNMDIDRIRDLIGGWREHIETAGLLARSVALAGARVHLGAGHDVVVPQLLARPTFIEQAAALADELGSAFHEVVLIDSKRNAIQRFVDRSRSSTEPGHRDAGEMLERQGGLAELEAVYDRLTALVATRPATKVVRTRAGEIEQAYRDFLDVLA
ncbi:hypothetical protein Asi03nite_66590 [Actinoplanes siamensis]|uniref:Uncharacterized protein n=2 Tax=Actinoplanes siamensis TaxID=1223317 RepID=A0A919NDY6_9ACTN|nr:hypothetical protein Asi03nite_66590 [Actinoplanes siamensis]